MEQMHPIKITTRDRLFLAWVNSMELVRDFRLYAEESKDNKEISETFNKYAEDECFHASKLLEFLNEFEENKK